MAEARNFENSFIHENDDLEKTSIRANITGIGDSLIDAFGRLRVANPVSLFDSQLQYDDQPLIWNTELIGSGTTTHLPNESALSLDLTTASGDKVTRQVRDYIRYQPGKSQLILATFVLGAEVENSSKRIGYFDDNNGYYLEQNGSTICVVQRTKTSGSVVNNRVFQDDWNLDILDGTGKSEDIIDFTKSQIFVLDLEWLGTGRVRLGFYLHGTIHYVHEFLHANTIDTVHIGTPNLPVRYQIENSDTTSVAPSMKQICTTIISEGGVEDDRGLPFSVSNEFPPVSVGTSEIPVLSIQPLSEFNGIQNRIKYKLTDIRLYARTNEAHCKIYYKTNLGNAAFSNVSSEFSSMGFDTSANTFTEGIAITQVTVPAAAGQNPASDIASITNKLPIGFDIDGSNADIITITANARTGTSDVVATLDWVEFR